MDLEPLKKAIAYGRGEFDLTDIIRLSDQGMMQIMKIPNLETLAVTEVVKYPKKTRLRVILLSGVFNPKVVTFMESFAKAMGLDGIEVIGRKGWVRALKPFGYDEASVNILKDFSKGESHE